MKAKEATEGSNWCIVTTDCQYSSYLSHLFLLLLLLLLHLLLLLLLLFQAVYPFTCSIISRSYSSRVCQASRTLDINEAY